MKETMLIEEDFFTLNQYDSTNNDTNEEEAIIRNVLTPCIKRMDSSDSIKSNDRYCIKSSSKFSQNYVNENVFNNSDSNCLMCGDYETVYYNTFNQDNNFTKKPNNNYSSFSGKAIVNNFATVINENDYSISLNVHGIKKGKFEEEIKEEGIQEVEIKGGEIKEEEGELKGGEIKEEEIKEVEIKEEEEIRGGEIKEEEIKRGKIKDGKKKGEITSIETETNEKLMKKQLKRGKRGPYKKKKKLIIETKTNDECFPFIKGKSLLSNGANNTQFITNKYITSSDGSQKREKKARKYKPDDIRKKIKVRFHKKIKNIINENLKKAGSIKLFSFLPQLFLGNISKKFNYQYMNKTFEEILSINFSDFQKKYPNKECDKKQFVKNKETLEYLENNEEISEISGFNELKKMKYRDILRHYFSSIEFEQSIKQLEIELEDNEYIQEYICLAKGYIDYFMDINNCK